jgi:UDP-N-acetylmuramate--alanine ligase
VVEVVTNIDLEHLDYYQNIDEIKAVFLQFINKIPFYGAAILCLDCNNIAELLPEIKKRVITYGLTAQADVHTRKIDKLGFGSRFDVCVGRDVLGEVTLQFPGIHNVYNALAAVAVGLELDIDFATIAAGLSKFNGVQRRLQNKGEHKNITVIDDYGHHPTEIKATLSALNDAWPDRRLVVLFQPHRYTRTQALFKEFCTAFHAADVLILTEIYPASEMPIEGVNSANLVAAIKERGQREVYLTETVDDLPQAVLPLLVEGDVVVTLGAGNVYKAGEELLRLLEQEM